MKNKRFRQQILKANYATKYEAILQKDSFEIFGYEALSKFDMKLNTEKIFKELHHDNKLFFKLERKNKKLQLENFNKDCKLFLNFDADIVKTEKQRKYWKKFLLDYKEKIIVEITENGSDDESSANIMKSFSNWLSKNKINAALDDFAQDGSMFSFHIMNNCQYIKIDKSFLKELRLNKNYIFYLDGFLKTIKANGKKSIIEGIENLSDLELIKDLDYDFLQGYYFSNLTYEI